jgi:hypothetical protein
MLFERCASGIPIFFHPGSLISDSRIQQTTIHQLLNTGGNFYFLNKPSQEVEINLKNLKLLNFLERFRKRFGPVDKGFKIWVGSGKTYY